MITVLQQIYLLLKTGFIEKKSEAILFLFLKIVLLFAFFKVLTIGVLFYLDYMDLLKKPENITQDGLRDLPKSTKLFLVVILGPIIEEMTYRLGLKFSKINFTVVCGFFSFALLRAIFELEILYAVLISANLAFGIYLSSNPFIIKNLADFWIKNRRSVFYFFIVTFALLHLRNYEITLSLVLLSPFHVLSHLVAGIFYSYARLQIGILAAILLHAINNGFMPALGFMIDLFK